MQPNGSRIWFNHKTGEVIDCKLHYDCDSVTKMIGEMGKMNFFRAGWCRLGVYDQMGKRIGIIEGYDQRAIRKSLDFLLSRHKVDTIITEKHDTNGYDMNIFDNPLAKERPNGI